MIYRHTEEQIQYYFDAPALNQSSIKTILGSGIQKFADEEDELSHKEDLFYEEKQHFIIGNAVDCIITQGRDVFDSKYAYSTLKVKPPEKIMSIVQKAFQDIPAEQAVAANVNIYKKQLYDSCNFHEYYMNRKIPSDKPLKFDEINELTKQKTGKTILGPDMRDWTEDKRVDSFLLDGTVAKYWNELIDSRGKQLLSEYEKDKVLSIADSLLGHAHTTGLFEDTPDKDIVFQMPLFFYVGTTRCKILPDQIIIDHIAKRVLIIDIKTMGDYVLRFNKAFRIRRYDIQGGFYRHGISLNLDKIGELIGKDISRYTISNPAFIVESTTKCGTPMIFVMSDASMLLGEFGDGNWTLGWRQGVQLYSEWKALDFSLDEKFKPTKGIVWLDGYDYSEIF